jgi:hypothetical protein
MKSVLLPTLLLWVFTGVSFGQGRPATSSATPHPRLIRFSGRLRDAAGKPLTGAEGVTFAIYSEADGGSPLWLETQTVQCDETGQYTALLGSATAEGLPLDLFTAYDERWLGAKPEGQEEQPRVLLVSVPYALRAEDANTVGGMTPQQIMAASSTPIVQQMVLQSTPQTDTTTTAGRPPGPTAPGTSSIAAPGPRISTYLKNSTQGEVEAYNDGTSTPLQLLLNPLGGNVGVGTTAPGQKLSVAGTIEATTGGFKFPDATTQATAGISPAAADARYSRLSAANAFTGNQSIAGSLSVSQGVQFPDATVQTTAGISQAAADSRYLSLAGGQLSGTLSTTGSIYATGNDFEAEVLGFDTAGGTGVRGTSDSGQGVHGNSDGGIGVEGLSTTSYGVHGHSNTNYGLFGESISSSGVYGEGYGNGPGVYGTSGGVGVKGVSTSSYGVYGTTGSSYGVFGEASNVGVVAHNTTSGSTANYAYLAGTCCAADLYGTVAVHGTLTKTAGSFKIDDPIDPANKYLSHSFVESPDMMNIYNGNIVTDGSGIADVTLPDWFSALNKDFRYQLTVIGVFAQAIIEQEIADNHFRIRTNQPNVKVSWQVTGIRHDPYADAHRIPVEEDKPTAEKGTYSFPELYGQRVEKGMRLALHPEPKKAD